jgi:DNA (cytosine-5)-methyltransferase 1
MAWNDVAPTITSGFVNPSKGRFLHPRQHRAITPREAALLQGFPIRYQVSLREGKFRAAELLGNALPPPFIRRLAIPVARCARRRSSPPKP